MSALLKAQDWQLIETPPLSGEVNMQKDRESVAAVSQGAAPIFRLFRFSEPTLSYGRLQHAAAAHTLNSKQWPMVQRPTAGGIVFHANDLCLSLCWQPGTAPLPRAPRDVYGWIHRLILQACPPKAAARLAACCDQPRSSVPFNQRQCFQEPVGYDVLADHEKIAGGALFIGKTACLYQGSIQRIDLSRMASRLQDAFRAALHS